MNVRRPKCKTCGSGACHPYKQGFGYIWLCGDCRYLQDHPDAPRASKLPRERSKRKQKETLFGG